jgi:site-specific DNA-methyltransferase (adenine-specific)
MKITNECNMELMARYEDNHFDLAIVDPPYGIDVTKMTLGNGKNKINRGLSNWDNNIPKKKYFDELKRVSKNYIVWGANYMTTYLPPSMGWIYWDKGTGANDFSDGELAFSSFNRALRSYKVSWVGANANNGTPRIHPTEKPIRLYEWILMNYAKEGDKILDTHLGSGSIAIACHNLGFDLTACELDKEYYEAATKRLNQHQAQITLF